MAEPWTNEELDAKREGLYRLRAAGLSWGWYEERTARFLVTIAADRERIKVLRDWIEGSGAELPPSEREDDAPEEQR